MQAQQALLQMQEQARQNQLVQEQNLLGAQLQNQQANTTAQQTLLSTEAQNQQNNIQTLYNKNKTTEYFSLPTCSICM